MKSAFQKAQQVLMKTIRNFLEAFKMMLGRSVFARNFDG